MPWLGDPSPSSGRGEAPPGRECAMREENHRSRDVTKAMGRGVGGRREQLHACSTSSRRAPPGWQPAEVGSVLSESGSKEREANTGFSVYERREKPARKRGGVPTVRWYIWSYCTALYPDGTVQYGTGYSTVLLTVQSVYHCISV